MGKIYALVLDVQEAEITARCYGSECGHGLLGAIFDDCIGALVPCAQEQCPFLEQQMDEPIGKDSEGHDVYLRKMTPLPANAALCGPREAGNDSAAG